MGDVVIAETHTSATAAVTQTMSVTDRFVTCRIADQTYAVPALMVREVVPWAPVTRVPNGAPAVKGVINLRGAIVPLIDLRLYFGLGATEITDRTCIVVVTTIRGSVTVQAGLIVDAALEVVRVPSSEMSAGQGALPGGSGRYVTGIAHVKGELIILLECQRLLADALTGHTTELPA